MGNLSALSKFERVRNTALQNWLYRFFTFFTTKFAKITQSLQRVFTLSFLPQATLRSPTVMNILPFRHLNLIFTLFFYYKTTSVAKIVAYF